ncbi:PIN domain-containing protein [Azohydromonas lata]|uniref:PIN domain-containing protein n=1 Tax=Azohydromonas lata TaxID=45677 RepID=A0ABU5IAV2_9BURK|nr:PIN domain-containing protein [Azohydromonas lata]MDZ5455790.1 PIN domain-containing protein [Azohydromonas lata]
MDIFHIVIDTNLMHERPFGHPDFKRLLRLSQLGLAKVYIPLIALEERRTQLVDKYEEIVAQLRSKAGELSKRELPMILEGLPQPVLDLPSREEVYRNSAEALAKFMTDHKIEVLNFTFEHATNAWDRYFKVLPPFNPNELREKRRKDIPDAWILEAAREVKKKPGRHCFLTKDKRAGETLRADGFEVWDDMERLDAAIEAAMSVVLLERPAPSKAPVPLDQLRSKAFDNVDRILLGVIDTWDAPDKETLFTRLEALGIRREIAEHEAKTLELSGHLADTGSHLIATDRDTAREAANDPIVQALLLKALDEGS